MWTGLALCLALVATAPWELRARVTLDGVAGVTPGAPGAVDSFVARARAPRFDVSPRGRVTRIALGNRMVRATEGCA